MGTLKQAMMKVRILTFFALTMMIFAAGCGNSKTAVMSTEDTAALEAMIQEQAFEINADWAIPLGTGAMNSLAVSGLVPPGSAINQINLQGTPNFLRIQGDSVSARLPYYGERQVGGLYGRASGIEFNGLATDLKIKKNEKKQSYEVSFRVKDQDQTEHYQVNAMVFPNMSSSVTVNSTQRFVIRYRGAAKALALE